jgi:lipoyl(octanoyl) transferase
MVTARPTALKAPETVGWKEDFGRPIEYCAAVEAMERRVAAIRDSLAPQLIHLLEHPPLYTAGTSSRPEDLLQPDRFPVYGTGRGGQYTYHGPGQLVAYVMLDLARRDSDVRRFVHDLEAWLIATLAHYGVCGERREGRVGIWVDRAAGPDGVRREDKIAAIGIRVRRWVTFHGISLNVDPDLDHFTGIVPCGVRGHAVTSLVDLGLPVTMTDADVALRAAFEEVFGPTAR